MRFTISELFWRLARNPIANISFSLFLVIAALLTGQAFFHSIASDEDNDRRMEIDAVMNLVAGRQQLRDPNLYLSASKALTRAGIRGEVTRIQKSDLPNILTVFAGKKVVWVTDDFRYLFTGPMVDVATRIDMSALLQAQWRDAVAIGKGGLVEDDLNSERAGDAGSVKDAAPAAEKSNEKRIVDGKKVAKEKSEMKESAARLPSGVDTIAAQQKEYAHDTEFSVIQQQLLNSEKEIALQADAALPKQNDGAALYEAETTGEVDIVKVGFNHDGSQMSVDEKKAQVAKLSATIPDAFTIKYPAQNEKAVITAFVDYTCSACRRLHDAIPSLNERGISVRMMFYPRAKAAGDSRMGKVVEENMANAWCAQDQANALDRLYAEGESPTSDCASLPKSLHRIGPPIEEHFALGEMFGLTGTPYIFMSNGNTMPGYSGIDDTVRLATEK